MALPSVRMEYRVALEHVDRGLTSDEPIVVARHPSETMDHLVLRVLAHCLLRQEGLVFGPGLSDGEGADLWAHDPTGRLSCWVECGATDADKLKRLASRNSGAAVHVVMSDERRWSELVAQAAELTGKRLDKGLDRVECWLIDGALVDGLARRDERRHKWTVTIVGDHFYVDADGEALDGAIRRERLA